jgi:hypothetical protein
MTEWMRTSRRWWGGKIANRPAGINAGALLASVPKEWGISQTGYVDTSEYVGMAVVLRRNIWATKKPGRHRCNNCMRLTAWRGRS